MKQHTPKQELILTTGSNSPCLNRSFQLHTFFLSPSLSPPSSPSAAMSYPHHSYPHHHHYPFPGRASYSTMITPLGPGFPWTRLQADLSSVRSQHVIATLRNTLSLLLVVSSMSLFTFLLLLPPIEAVTPSRKNTAEEYRMMMQDRALLNLNLMNTIGKCRDPRPLVVYPIATANKIFHPRGTVSGAGGASYRQEIVLNNKLVVLLPPPSPAPTPCRLCTGATT